MYSIYFNLFITLLDVILILPYKVQIILQFVYRVRTVCPSLTFLVHYILYYIDYTFSICSDRLAVLKILLYFMQNSLTLCLTSLWVSSCLGVLLISTSLG